LINSTIVDDVGYPIKKFFIWNDDFEYTRRITNKYEGYFSLRSKVLHKTERKHQATEGYSWKYYYEVRNKLWLIFKLNTFSKKERSIMFYYLVKSLNQHFKNVGFHKDNLKMIGRAIFNGFFSRPK
jgi:GT2 family glycosyltransferase